MPRIVPSQVVALTDRMFPQARRQAQGDRSGFVLDMGHLGPVSALVEMVNQVPTELLVLDGDSYSTFFASVAALRGAIPLWQSGDRLYRVQFIQGWELNPISLIRQALSACPDQVPAPGTVELVFIADADLRDSIRLDISAANTGLIQGEWKGTTVLAGSAIEALLLWALQEHEQQHTRTRQAAIAALRANNTLTQNPPGNPVDWSLHQYIEVAATLNIIKPETAIQARQAKDFRNLIHPGRAQRLAQGCDRGTALAALAAVEFVVRDLMRP